MTDLSKFKVASAFKHLDPNQGMADGISAGFSSLRYKGKSWNLNHGGQTYSFKQADGYNQPYIDLIILGVSSGLSKLYFGEWNEDNASGPICASNKGDVPDPGVSIPQSRTCGTCSHNEWRTGDKKGKECQDHKRMAVLLLPTMTAKMLPTPLLEPVYFKIPPGSLKSLKKYSDSLQFAGIPFAAGITRISFAEDKLFEMKFELIKTLSDAEAPLVLPMMEDQQTMTIVNGNGGMRQIAAPKQGVRQPAAAPPPEETGLLAAFGGAAPQQEVIPPAKKGRPKKVIPVDVDQPAPSQADVNNNDGEAWEESDTDLDDSVAKLMGDKMNQMLK